VIENLEGKATHRWEEGKYNWSDEVLGIVSVAVDCPTCLYKETFVRGTDEIPEWVWRRIKKARTFEKGMVQ